MPMLLESDEKDFIIGMASPQMPIWVWTSDGIQQETINKLCEYFYSRFRDNQTVCYVAKPDIAAILSNPFKEKREPKNTV